MRLTPEEIDCLITAITEFLQGAAAELRLYGSRTNDNLKGGDIDLLLLLDNPQLINQLLAQKHFILARIKELISDQKIDLKIVQSNEIAGDPFLSLIYPQSLVLKSWK